MRCANGPLVREQGSEGLYEYHAFGLKLASELELPELHPGRGPADLTIHFHRLPIGERAPDTPWAEISDDGLIIRLEGIRYLVNGGTSIDIAAPSGLEEANIRSWLLGTVAAAVLHQRGYLPIHANVIVHGAEAAAFAGDSGAGKSTLAAWMEVQGRRVLTDDLCAIQFLSEGAVVFEGIPRVKLWGDTLRAFGRTPEGLAKVATDLDKYQVPLGTAPREGSLEPMPLTRIYLLDRAAEGEAFRIERLSGIAAAEGVLKNAFRWGLGQLIQEQKRLQFDQCVALARQTAVFRVYRTGGMERFEAEAGLVARHLEEAA